MKLWHFAFGLLFIDMAIRLKNDLPGYELTGWDLYLASGAANGLFLFGAALLGTALRTWIASSREKA